MIRAYALYVRSLSGVDVTADATRLFTAAPLAELGPEAVGWLVSASAGGKGADTGKARAAALAATRVTAEQLVELDAACDRAEGLTGNNARTVDTLIAANEDFHRIVIAAAGSPRLSGALRTVAGIPRPFKTVFWNDTAERARSLAAHREIVASLRAGSADRAESAMRLHVMNARDFLIEVMD